MVQFVGQDLTRSGSAADHNAKLSKLVEVKGPVMIRSCLKDVSAKMVTFYPTVNPA